MLHMFRVKLVLLVLFAAIVAVGPTLHNHSLIPAPGPDVSHPPNFCAACVAGTARIASPAPAITAPVVVMFATPTVHVPVLTADARGPVPARAPPAA